MSPSFRRIAPFILLTIVYWPIALYLLGLGAMGDCYPGDAACEGGRAAALWKMFAGEAAVYAAIVLCMIRRGTRL